MKWERVCLLLCLFEPIQHGGGFPVLVDKAFWLYVSIDCRIDKSVFVLCWFCLALFIILTRDKRVFECCSFLILSVLCVLSIILLNLENILHNSPTACFWFMFTISSLSWLRGYILQMLLILSASTKMSEKSDFPEEVLDRRLELVRSYRCA